MEYCGDVRKTFNTEKLGGGESCKPACVFDSQNPGKKRAEAVPACAPSIPTRDGGWRQEHHLEAAGPVS